MKKLKRFLSQILGALLIFGWAVSFSSIAKAKVEEDCLGKIRICHRTASINNPYVSLSIDYHAADGMGKNDHSHHTGSVFDPATIQQGDTWGDIIPPHHNYPGLNWIQGQAIWDNQCRVILPSPSPSPSLSPTPTPTPTETIEPTPSPTPTLSPTPISSPSAVGGTTTNIKKPKVTPQVLGTTEPTPAVGEAQEPLPVSGADINLNWLYYFLIIGSLLVSYYLKIYGWKKLAK